MVWPRPFRLGNVSPAEVRFGVEEEEHMTEKERLLLLLVAEYVRRELASEIGRVASAKQRSEEFEQAMSDVIEESGQISTWVT